MRLIIPAALIAATFAPLPTPFASAGAQQLSPGYSFLKAVEDRDGTKATSMLQTPGNTVVNAQRSSDGRTAMHLVIERRDPTWITFLLANQANPNIGDRNGDTPLMLATQLGYLEGMELLLKYGGKVDQPNRAGETPLIRAVQLRDSEAIRLLMKNGANPNITDHASGRSALEYAKLDRRANDLVSLLQPKADADEKTEAEGELDFSGIK